MAKTEKKLMLIVDGNLLARKSFYKFRNLSSKVILNDVKNISKKLYKKKLKEISPDKKLKLPKSIVSENNGKKIKLNRNSQIDSKIEQIKLGRKEVELRTGVLFGSLRSVLAIRKNLDIREIIFCFDPPSSIKAESDPTQERFILYPDYKNRKRDLQTELEFEEGLFLLQQFLFGSGFVISRSSKYEADDILHYFTHKKYRDRNHLVLTNDHDLNQILNNRVSILEKTENDFEIKTEKSFIEKKGYSPEKYIDVLTLSGCNTDNVPGIKGIGKETAEDLIRKFGSIKKILELIRTDENRIPIRPLNALKKDRENKYKDLILSRKLVSLYGLSKDFEDSLSVFKNKEKPEKSIKYAINTLKTLKFKSFLNEKSKKLLKTTILEQKNL